MMALYKCIIIIIIIIIIIDYAIFDPPYDQSEK